MKNFYIPTRICLKEHVRLFTKIRTYEQSIWSKAHHTPSRKLVKLLKIDFWVYNEKRLQNSPTLIPPNHFSEIPPSDPSTKVINISFSLLELGSLSFLVELANLDFSPPSYNHRSSFFFSFSHVNL